MGMYEIPEMTPKQLEEVLKHLPEPAYAEVALYGNFDYSGISHQAQEVVQGAKLQDTGGLVFKLEDASKEKILDIYKKSYELKNSTPPTDIQLLSSQTAYFEGEQEGKRQTGEWCIQRRIDLHKVGWYLEDHVQIELTPWEVNVKYTGQEPNYISQMRQKLVETDVGLGIGVNIAIGVVEK